MAEDYKDVKKKIFNICSLLDSQLRVSSEGLNFSKLETEFLDNWLKTGQVDPILGSVIAQVLGMREMPDEEETSDAS